MVKGVGIFPGKEKENEKKGKHQESGCKEDAAVEREPGQRQALPSCINPCSVQVCFPLSVMCRHLENYTTWCERIPAQKPPHMWVRGGNFF